MSEELQCQDIVLILIVSHPLCFKSLCTSLCFFAHLILLCVRDLSLKVTK